MKRCSTQFTIKKAQIKITKRYYYKLIRMSKIKKIVTTSNADGDAEKLDL